MNHTINDTIKSYDVLIIGGGISGLTSSALLTKAGLSCCLIEMSGKPGGYLAGFDRKSFRFDSAIHWLNNCGPDGLVGRIFSIAGNDFPKAKHQKSIRRFISKDFNYLVTNNPDELKQQWIQLFPEDKAGIVKFFKDAKRIAKSFDNYINLSRSMDTMNLIDKGLHGLKMLSFVIPFLPHLRYTGDLGIIKGLSKYFTNAKLKEVFSSEPDLLSCLIPISWAYSNNFQTPPSGGSQRFAEWLIHVTKELGGEIHLGTKVIEILVKNDAAYGVKVQKKQQITEIQCRYIVAACDATVLYDKLLPPTRKSQQKLKLIEQAKLYSSGLSVSIGLDCKAEDLGLGEENIYFAETTLDREKLGNGDPYTSGMHILASSVRDKTLAPLNKGTITLFIPAFISDNNYWGCEIDENGQYVRGRKYREIKKEYADILIGRVEKGFIPTIREHIEFLDVATPMTLLRYTGNKEGTMMGQKPGKENMQLKVAGYKTPYKNIYQSGHWADYGGGILIAMKSAVNTTLMILKKEKPKTFKLLSSYIDGKLGLSELQAAKVLVPYINNWISDPTPAQRADESIEITN